MNATCQVTHLSPGRTRLYIPNAASQPDVYHRLVQFALSLPDVTRVELEPNSASVTLIHASTPQAREAILRTLRGAAVPGDAPQTAAAAPPALPGTAAPTVAPEAQAPAAILAAEDRPLATAPAPRPACPPYADGAVVHAMRGRLRLRIPALQTDGALAGVLTHFLSQQPGVQDVRPSRLSGGIAIAFDPAVTDARTLARLVGAYQPDAAAFARWKASLAARRPRQRRQTVLFQTSLALAAAALALDFFGAPGLLIFVLLLAASWPILRRAGQTLFVRRQFSLELLAVTVMLLLWVTGRIGQAAGFVAVLAALEWLRSSPQKSLDHALAGGFDWLRTFSSAAQNPRPITAPRQAIASGGPGPALPLHGAAPTPWLANPQATAASTPGAPPAHASIAANVGLPIQR